MADRSFEQRYQDNDIPWDRTRPDSNLIDSIQQFSIPPGRVLDLGCGTGINALWLAQHGFETTGLDCSPTAIQKAEQRAAEHGAAITWITADFMTADLSGPFDLVFDRGCFHCFDSLDQRKDFARRVHDLLTDDGLWLSLIGNADDAPREVGPPTLSAAEIAEAVESCFEIVSLRAGCFGGGQDDPPKAWIALLKKRA